MGAENDTFYLSIAGFSLQITFRETEWVYTKEKIKRDIYEAFKPFVVNQGSKKINFGIEFTDANIFEVLFLKKEGHNFINIFTEKSHKKIVSYYKISIYQFQLILRYVLQKLLAENNGFHLHSSAIKFHNRAVLFVGQPGAGKSTIVSLLKNKYHALADDSVIVKKESDSFYFYPPPFYEKESWIKKEAGGRYNIEKIFFLKKSKFFKIEKLENSAKVFRMMLEQLISESKARKATIKILLEFIKKFNEFYFLYFAKKGSELIKLFDKL